MRARIASLVIGSVLLATCSPPAATRPREGAPVVAVRETTRIDAGSVAPPTPALPTPALAALGVTPTPSAPEPSPPSLPMTPTHVIAATGGTGVNMRAGPSTAAPVITTLREGTLVEALGEPVSVEGRQWQEIRVGDREGWVVAVVVRPR
jgi:hypothetical protein